MNSADIRIVSLIPSATEIVCALGYQQYLVGRSHECDFPEGISTLSVCTAPKFDPVGSSGEIHQRVTELLTKALSVYRVDFEQLQELRPTHIITQAQCEVCAVSLADVQNAIARLAEETGMPSPHIISLQPMQLTDLWSDIAEVGCAIAATSAPPEQTAQVIAQLQQRVSKLKAWSMAIAPGDRPRVACIEWSDPLMAAGNWVPELVNLAGGEDCLGKAGAHSNWLSWEEIEAADPDILVMMPCGYGLNESRKATAELAENERWQQLRAMRNNNVYLTDGNHYFNRPGPRLVDSAEILREIIHTYPVNAQRHSVGWERF